MLNIFGEDLVVWPNDSLTITGTNHKDLKQLGQQIRDNRIASGRAPDDNRVPFNIADFRKAKIHFPYPASPQRDSKRKDNPSSSATGSSQDHKGARTSKGKGKLDRGDKTLHKGSKGRGKGARTELAVQNAPWQVALRERQVNYDKARLQEQNKMTKLDVSTRGKPVSFTHQADEVRLFEIWDPEQGPIYTSHAVAEGFLEDPELQRNDIYITFGRRSNLICMLFCKCIKYSTGKTVMLPYPLIQFAEEN